MECDAVGTPLSMRCIYFKIDDFQLLDVARHPWILYLKVKPRGWFFIIATKRYFA